MASNRDLFAVAQQFGVPELHVCVRPEVGLYAVVAIHSTARGPALGGCRCVPYGDAESAVADAAQLARAMSYKAAISDLPLGGGKSVVVDHPGLTDRAACFAAFGDFIEHLGGRYVVTEDSGTGEPDMDVIATRTRHVVGTSRAQGGCGDPSPSTALGVCAGIQAAVEHRFGSPSLEGVHVVIQGVGHVGYALACELHQRGARLSVTDRSEDAARRCAAEFGARIVATDAVGDLAADVFAPCALGGVLDRELASRLRVGVVAGAANNQLADPDIGRLLHERNVLYAPDYVINAGGLIHVAMWHREDIRPRLLAIGQRLRTLFQQARAEGRRPEQVADSVAESMLSL